MARGGSYGGRGGSRAIPLHDAEEDPPSDPGDGRCCIAWDADGRNLVVASSHAHLLFHSPPPSSSPSPSPSPPPLLRLSHHRSAVTSVAVSPSGRSIASGSLDHSVKLYSYPDGEFQSNVTRFTLPIHSVAFSPTGSMLAAAGEDDGIKLISTIDSSIIRVFKGHNAPVVSLAFDPNNDFLASSGTDGTIMCWSLSSGKRVHTLYHAAPNIGSSNSSRNEIAWHPKGDVLAVPGRKDGVDVVMYDRDTGEKVFSLKGGHSATVGFLAWSSNGKYLATAAGDNQVIVWDVDNRQDMDCQKFESQICSLAWKPKGNGLALIDSDGKFGVWDPVIPSHMTLPSDDSSTPSVIDREELLRFSDDEEQIVSEDESQPSSDERDLDPIVDVSHHKKFKDKDAGRKLNKHQNSSLKETEILPPNQQSSPHNAGFLKMQKAFQPCSTRPDSGKRHFLTYNVIGNITSFQNEGLCHVEVEFHDTGKGVRIPSMTDYFGFTMAAMSEGGCVFASPRKGEKNPSMILYRPFSSWASNSEWSVRLLSDEEVTTVAVGSSWVAASTSQNYLRLFSEGGLQIFVTSIDGPALAMVGHHEFLAVVTHQSSPFPCGQPALSFKVLNIAEHTKVLEGRMPISPGSHLTWVGFSETGILSSYDSKGILRVHSKQYGGCWIPVFSASKAVKSEEESIWMVGLNTTQVMCVVCNLPDNQPQVTPKPILSLFKLSLPLVHSDLGAEELENELLLGNLQLAQMIEDTTFDEDEQEEEILKLEASLDRHILRLIATACKGDKLLKVEELTKKLTLDKSWKGAIKLVSAMKLPALAERLSALYEEKMARESSQTKQEQTDLNGSGGLSRFSAQSSKESKIEKQLDVATTRTEFALPVRNNTTVMQQEVRDDASKNESTKEKQEMRSSSSEGNAVDAEESAAHSSIEITPNPRSNNPFAKTPSSNPFAKTPSSNPFAKPSSSDVDSTGGSSLFQSLKRMRGNEDDPKANLKPSKPVKGSK